MGRGAGGAGSWERVGDGSGKEADLGGKPRWDVGQGDGHEQGGEHAATRDDGDEGDVAMVGRVTDVSDRGANGANEGAEEEEAEGGDGRDKSARGRSGGRDRSGCQEASTGGRSSGDEWEAVEARLWQLVASLQGLHLRDKARLAAWLADSTWRWLGSDGGCQQPGQGADASDREGPFLGSHAAAHVADAGSDGCPGDDVGHNGDDVGCGGVIGQQDGTQDQGRAYSNAGDGRGMAGRGAMSGASCGQGGDRSMAATSLRRVAYLMDALEMPGVTVRLLMAMLELWMASGPPTPGLREKAAMGSRHDGASIREDGAAPGETDAPLPSRDAFARGVGQGGACGASAPQAQAGMTDGWSAELVRSLAHCLAQRLDAVGAMGRLPRLFELLVGAAGRWARAGAAVEATANPAAVTALGPGDEPRRAAHPGGQPGTLFSRLAEDIYRRHARILPAPAVLAWEAARGGVPPPPSAGGNLRGTWDVPAGAAAMEVDWEGGMRHAPGASISGDGEGKAQLLHRIRAETDVTLRGLRCGEGEGEASTVSKGAVMGPDVVATWHVPQQGQELAPECVHMAAAEGVAASLLVAVTGRGAPQRGDGAVVGAGMVLADPTVKPEPMDWTAVRTLPEMAGVGGVLEDGGGDAGGGMSEESRHAWLRLPVQERMEMVMEAVIESAVMAVAVVGHVADDSMPGDGVVGSVGGGEHERAKRDEDMLAHHEAVAPTTSRVKPEEVGGMHRGVGVSLVPTGRLGGVSAHARRSLMLARRAVRQHLRVMEELSRRLAVEVSVDGKGMEMDGGGGVKVDVARPVAGSCATSFQPQPSLAPISSGLSPLASSRSLEGDALLEATCVRAMTNVAVRLQAQRCRAVASGATTPARSGSASANPAPVSLAKGDGVNSSVPKDLRPHPPASPIAAIDRQLIALEALVAGLVARGVISAASWLEGGCPLHDLELLLATVGGGHLKPLPHAGDYTKDKGEDARAGAAEHDSKATEPGSGHMAGLDSSQRQVGVTEEAVEAVARGLASVTCLSSLVGLTPDQWRAVGLSAGGVMYAHGASMHQEEGNNVALRTGNSLLSTAGNYLLSPASLLGREDAHAAMRCLLHVPVEVLAPRLLLASALPRTVCRRWASAAQVSASSGEGPSSSRNAPAGAALAGPLPSGPILSGPPSGPLSGPLSSGSVGGALLGTPLDRLLSLVRDDAVSLLTHLCRHPPLRHALLADTCALHGAIQGPEMTVARIAALSAPTAEAARAAMLPLHGRLFLEQTLLWGGCTAGGSRHAISGHVTLPAANARGGLGRGGTSKVPGGADGAAPAQGGQGPGVEKGAATMGGHEGRPGTAAPRGGMGEGLRASLSLVRSSKGKQGQQGLMERGLAVLDSLEMASFPWQWVLLRMTLNEQGLRDRLKAMPPTTSAPQDVAAALADSSGAVSEAEKNFALPLLSRLLVRPWPCAASLYSRLVRHLGPELEKELIQQVSWLLRTDHLLLGRRSLHQHLTVISRNKRIVAEGDLPIGFGCAGLRGCRGGMMPPVADASIGAVASGSRLAEATMGPEGCHRGSGRGDASVAGMAASAAGERGSRSCPPPFAIERALAELVLPCLRRTSHELRLLFASDLVNQLGRLADFTLALHTDPSALTAGVTGTATRGLGGVGSLSGGALPSKRGHRGATEGAGAASRWGSPSGERGAATKAAEREVRASAGVGQVAEQEVSAATLQISLWTRLQFLLPLLPLILLDKNKNMRLTLAPTLLRLLASRTVQDLPFLDAATSLLATGGVSTAAAATGASIPHHMAGGTGIEGSGGVAGGPYASLNHSILTHGAGPSNAHVTAVAAASSAAALAGEDLLGRVLAVFQTLLGADWPLWLQPTEKAGVGANGGGYHGGRELPKLEPFSDMARIQVNGRRGMGRICLAMVRVQVRRYLYRIVVVLGWV
eukprot:jgi/Mesvir1/26859/Mv25127-RA.2